MTLVIAKTLDCKGLSCPLPIVKTAQAMRVLAPGDVIEVLATDLGATKDFAAWSKATGNPLLESTADAGVLRFVLMKKR